LRANGCPWDGDVLGVARGHILDWVEENGLSVWSDSDSDSSANSTDSDSDSSD